MKDPDHAKLDAYCEQLHKALDAIRAIVWEPNTTLPRVRHKVALVLKEIDRRNVRAATAPAGFARNIPTAPGAFSVTAKMPANAVRAILAPCATQPSHRELASLKMRLPAHG